MVCKWPPARNNNNNLLILHAIRTPYLLTFMKVYCNYVIEWRSFQPTSISLLSRDQNEIFLIRPPCEYILKWPSVMKCLETSKNPRHISKHYFMSTSLEWAETVLKSVHVLKLVFQATQKYWHMLMTPRKSVFLAFTEEGACETTYWWQLTAYLY